MTHHDGGTLRAAGDARPRAAAFARVVKAVWWMAIGAGISWISAVAVLGRTGEVERRLALAAAVVVIASFSFDVVRPARRGRAERAMFATGWGGVGIAGTMALFAVTGTGRHCRIPAWVDCDNAMRDVENGMEAYASDHSGRYPERFEELWEGRARYVGTSGLAWMAKGAATRPAGAEFRGEDVGIWYVGGGATKTSAKETVLIVEQSWTHADGSVHYVSVGGIGMLEGGEARALLGQVRRRVRPVRPTTQAVLGDEATAGE